MVAQSHIESVVLQSDSSDERKSPSGSGKSGRRAKILTAARSLFYRHGFKKTTLDDIALSTGLAKTSLYYYFGSKEELFAALIHREYETLLKKLREVTLRQPAPLEKLKAYAAARFEHINQLLSLGKLTESVARELFPLISGEEIRFHEAEKKLVTEIVTEGIEGGVFRKGDPEFIAFALISALKGIEAGRIFYGNDKIDERAYDVALELMLNGVLK